MENKRHTWKWQWVSVLAFSAMLVMLLFLLSVSPQTKTPVIRRVLRANKGNNLWIDVKEKEVMMSNGLVHVIFSNPDGDVTGISYNGIGNLLEIQNLENNRGYWDIVCNSSEIKNGTIDKLNGTKFEIIKSDENQIEIAFKRVWNVSMKGIAVPLNIDKRYILLRGYTGFYTYAILERLDGFPAMGIGQTRIVYKLQNDKFHYMAISDDRQRIMPTPNDRETGQPLNYPEAVLLTNASNLKLRGEVDDKYQYSIENIDNKVHGWISSDPPVGFWMITPSNEFRNAGPNHQDLTSHVGPVVLSMFVSSHYGGKTLGQDFKDGEPWKMVYGPVSVYLNKAPKKAKNYHHKLWENAKKQMKAEVKKWPYSFPQSKDFLGAAKRGKVVGQLLVLDRYVKKSLIKANSAYVGLATPGVVGSWQRESKGYQFWTRADKKGYFSIKNVRPGNYSLYAWVPGFIGDYMYKDTITIQSGCKIKLEKIVFEPPRVGPTLWEIGIPDRSSAEFYVPDPFPTLMNPLLNTPQNKIRQYGIWDRYAELYPHEDLIYTVGVSNYHTDWFYAQVTRSVGNSTYKPTTWQIVFPLENYISGNYTLQLALAAAAESDLSVRFNNRTAESLLCTGTFGGDNAIARHGVHGLYWLFSINVPSTLLHKGNNTIYLTQSLSINYFQGVMYDYIRFEGPKCDG